MLACSPSGGDREPVATQKLADGPAPSCNLNAPFDPPQPAFTGTTIAGDVTFSQDELTAYVTAKLGSSTNYDLYVTKRTSLTSSFDPLAAVGVLNTYYDERAPFLSDDGLKLYVTKRNSGNGTDDLAVATRASTAVEFSDPPAFPPSNPVNTASFHDQDPFFLTLPSRTDLYFASESPSGIRDVYVSTLTGGAYSTPVALSVNTPEHEDYRPVLSRDGLTLYFASTRPGIGNDGEGDVWVAKRTSTSDPFGPATNPYGLNSSHADFPVALSPDGCTLYFASARDTSSPQDFRLYQAKRGQSTPATVTTTLNVIGPGSVTTAPFACSTSCSGQGAPDSTVLVQASGLAYWSGSCAGNNATQSSDGVVVFTNGGVCTVTFDWSPEDLDPLAWYVAHANDVSLAGGLVSAWNDRSGNARHVVQPFVPAQPEFRSNGWDVGKPTVHFEGDLLKHEAWSGVPGGTDAAFTVLAVMRSAEPQDAGIASWWSPGGTELAWAALKDSNGQTVLDLSRVDSISQGQAYTSVQDLGTLGHAVAWRYSPSDHLLRLSIDGVTRSSETLPVIGALPGAMPFIIGAKTLLPTSLFEGDISELVVVDRSISDAELRYFTEYARRNWPGIPEQAGSNPCLNALGQSVTDGTRCDDGNAATYGDGCVAGTCVGDVPGPGSPAELSPSAWYHAGRSEVVVTGSGISTWFDRSPNARDLAQAFDPGRPKLIADGWQGNGNKPTVRFDGGDLLRYLSWPDSPTGDNAPFTVLAVLKSSLEGQNSAIAAWWNGGTYGKVSTQLKGSGSATFADLFRSSDGNVHQEFQSTTDLGLGRHAIVWRYSPDTLKITLDGTTSTSTVQPIGAISPGTFLVGNLTDFSSALFRGDISELAVIPTAISDQEVVDFNGYVKDHWGGVTFGCGSNSDCATGSSCTNGTCVEGCQPGAPGCAPGHCGNGAKDQDETDIDCGGSCEGCETGGECGAASDCAPGLDCGENNGACYGHSRSKRVCWPPACADPTGDIECGEPNSPCGQNCSCVEPCDPDAPTDTCEAGEACMRNFGRFFGSESPDICLRDCPSLDPNRCGGFFSECGPFCFDTPDCATATCENPSDLVGGECEAVCDAGEECLHDLHCPQGYRCIGSSSGSRTCRPEICGRVALKPPLCGEPNSLCGECPECTPQCDGRQCGLDPLCEKSCGTCGGGMYCDNLGQCRTPSSDPPITVPDGEGGTREVEDLPKAPASPVGAIPGQFSVSEQGTSQYVIPIEVPPGRAGLEPALSLRYGGTRAGGHVGTGWYLDGLSRITRCPHIHALDGYAGPVTNEPTDLFCIDGKRLTTIEESEYGANGTEYRTIIDSFARIISYQDGDGIQLSSPGSSVARALQGPDYFSVWTNDGRILTFGRTADSTLIARNGVRHAWLLSRIEDRLGNNVIITYSNLSPCYADQSKVLPTEVIPSMISYTGFGDTAGNRQVYFSYEPRTDPGLRFMQGGVASYTTSRLTRITTYVDAVPVRNYSLKYRDRTFSQVERILDCEGDEEVRCKPPTKFTYVEESGFTARSQFVDLTRAGQLDANGDGLPDFMKTTVTVDGVPANPTMAAVEISSDIAVGVTTSFILSPAIGVPVAFLYSIFKPLFLGWLADEPEVDIVQSMLLSTTSRGLPADVNNVSGVPCGEDPAPSVFLDYDQDGKDDIAAICDNQMHIAESAGNGNFHTSYSVISFPTQTGPTTTGGQGGRPMYVSGGAPVIFDVNGDSLQDVISCTSTSGLELRLRASPTTGFHSPIGLGSGNVQTNLPLCGGLRPTYNIFDIDGDGAPNLLVRHVELVLTSNPRAQVQTYEDRGGWRVLRYSLENGVHRLEFLPVEMADWNESNQGKGLHVADYNADGLVDISSVRGNQIGLWLNQGTGSFAHSVIDRPRIAYPEYNSIRTALLDYDADGRTDWLEHWRTSQGSSFNDVLLSNSDLTLLEAREVPEILEPWANGLEFPGRFTTAADVDADGNMDVFGDAHIFYGSGARNLLLETIEDGLGNVTRVGYDASGKYTTDCEGTTWPETCMRNLNGLVTGHSEGFIDNDGQVVTERAYEYSYKNARVNVTGHGWLGFDSREIRETSGTGNVWPHTTIVRFEPVARYRLDGTLTTETTPPYLYPLAGLPKTIISDKPIAETAAAQPLDAGLYRRRIRVENTWQVQLSHTSLFGKNLPYPALTNRSTQTFDRPRPAPLEPEIPIDENGTLLSDMAEVFDVDSLGRVDSHDTYIMPGENSFGGIDGWEEIHVNSFYQADITNWLIGNLTSTVVQNRNAQGDSQNGVILTYDEGRGVLETVTRYSNTGTLHKATYHRDEVGNPEQVVETVTTGQASRTTTITYDSDKVHPRTITNAKGHVTQLSYEPSFGRLATVVDPNNVIQQLRYDGLGLLTEAHDEGGTTIVTHGGIAPAQADGETAVGRIRPRIEVGVERRGTDDLLGGREVQQFDNRGRLVRTRKEGFGGQEVIEEINYDLRGRVDGFTFPHTEGASVVTSSQYFYDGLDRVTRIERTDGTAVQKQYASRATLVSAKAHWIAGTRCGSLPAGACVGDVELSIDEEDRSVVLVRDVKGRVIRSIDGDNVDDSAHTNDYDYTALDSLSRAYDNDGRIALGYTYDLGGRLIVEQSPTGPPNVYTYNAYDEVATHRTRDDTTHTYSYDVLGRLESITGPSGTTTWTYDQGVNGIGRLSETVSPGSSEYPNGQRVVFTYESFTAQNRGALARTDYVIDGVTYPIGFSYDSLGRIDRVEYPQRESGAAIAAKYHYDSSGSLTGVDQDGGATPVPLWRINDAFQAQYIEQETFGNGVTTTYDYHLQRHWLEGIDTKRGSEPLQNFTYTHYDNGLLERSTRNGTEVRTHFYDALNRIDVSRDDSSGTPGPETPYAYNNNGSITQRGTTAIGYETARPRMIDTVGDNEYDYYPNGNLERRSGPGVPGGVQTFEYTRFDLPKVIRTGTGSAEKVTRFEYTADEERVVRRDPDSTRHFAGDLYQRLTTAGGSTIEERFRLYAGDRVLAEIVRENGVDQTLYLHQDRLGTVDAITTGSGPGTRQEFDTWGTPLGSQQAELTRAGYTGHQHDRDLGLIDMNGRIYDPLSATFLTPDPIVQDPYFSQGLNRYSYVFNDPTNGVDPSGFVAVWGLAPGYPMGVVPVMGIASPIGFGFSLALNGIGGTSFGGSAGGTVVGATGAAAPKLPPGAAGMHATGQNNGRVGPPTAVGAPGKSLACGRWCMHAANDFINRNGPRVVDALKRAYDAAKPVVMRAGQRAADVASRIANKISPPAVAKTVPNANKLNHIFGKAEHALDGFVKAQGGREKAFEAIQKAANKALAEGKLVPGPNGVLPSGNAGPIIDVGGTQIRLIGGRVIDGVVEIGSASRMGLP